MTVPLAQELDFEDMFERAPVSLWIGDYSLLKQIFDEWRAQGVSDLIAFLQEDPARLQRCCQSLRVLRVNQHTLDFFNATDQSMLQSRLHEVLGDEILDNRAHELLALWQGHHCFENRTVNYVLPSKTIHAHITGRVLSGYENCWSRVLLALQDITAEVCSTTQLQKSEQYARGLFEHSPVSLWVENFSAVKVLIDEVRARGVMNFEAYLKTHPDFVQRCMQAIQVLDVNQQTLKMFAAHSKAELLHKLPQIFRDEMHASFSAQLLDLWNGKLVQRREAINYSLTGEPLNVHMEFSVMAEKAENWSLVLLSMVDITARKKAEAYLEYLGQNDVLTQLRNRAFYIDELNRLARKGPWPLSVLAIDMNGLKAVNDQHGHAAGDAALRRIGEVLSKAVDLPACAARVGGDEFMVLLPGTDERGAQAMQERILSLMELNNQYYPGQPIHIAMGFATGHAGVAIDGLVNSADQAMYADKARYYQTVQQNRRVSNA